jgi:hypothetical protein
MNNAPRLLIEWSSPWQEFLSAVGPALRRSPPALNIETRAGLFPFRGILATLLLEAAALATVVVLPRNEPRPVSLQTPNAAHDVIYFSADELPRTEDLAGAPRGFSGTSGGASARHRIQAIKVARDASENDRVADAPHLNLPKSDLQLANLLAYKANTGPAPAEALSLNRQEHPVSPLVAVVAPPVEIQRTKFRPTQLANSAVVPPPVDLPQEGISSRRDVSIATTVVPPPVSAPARTMNSPAQLTLPLEAVVAPRPEIGGAVRSRQLNNEFSPRVVAPPVELAAIRTKAHPDLTGLQAVAPPPSELRDLRRHAAGTLGNAAVAPPPPDVEAVRRRRVVQESSVLVALPPKETTTYKSTGAGDSKGSVSSATGVVVSPQPGDKPALPVNPEKATIAMAPSGLYAAGSGGEGGGSGTGRGKGSGSSASAASSGAASGGAEKGASSSNRTGNSTYPGPGGAGNLAKGSPRVPGVSVSGGSNMVTLPSFGTTPDPAASGRSNIAKSTGNGITVVASPRSGGAMNFYGALKGDRVYTIYIRTTIGTAVMQFADPASTAHPYANDLSAPAAIRAEIPADLRVGKLIISCVLDRSGVVKNARLLQSDAADSAAKVLPYLPNWKFSPALRGSEAVEVNAIIGFGVDTK